MAVTDQPEQARPGPSCSYVLHIIGRLFARITGWRVAGALPNARQMVVIAAPHTTNWDFIYLMMAAWALHLKICWMGKHTLFRFPLGILMRALGGIAIDRSSPNDIVTQITDRFNAETSLAVVIAPGGTRHKTDYWHSGFYWIALNARVPLVCGYLDYEQREAGLGTTFTPTGDKKSDMDVIRAFYSDKVAKYPDKASTVRLRDEASPHNS